jgi:hypothetical protein
VERRARPSFHPKSIKPGLVPSSPPSAFNARRTLDRPSDLTEMAIRNASYQGFRTERRRGRRFSKFDLRLIKLRRLSEFEIQAGGLVPLPHRRGTLAKGWGAAGQAHSLGAQGDSTSRSAPALRSDSVRPCPAIGPRSKWRGRPDLNEAPSVADQRRARQRLACGRRCRTGVRGIACRNHPEPPH